MSETPETNDGTSFAKGAGDAPRPPTIDLPKARELLAAAVETQGRDFVYNPSGVAGCQYMPALDTPEDDPRHKTGCLVGTALSLHGIDVSNLWGSVYGGLRVAQPGMMTKEAAKYFQVAQTRQDNGSSWGEAFDTAEDRAASGALDGISDYL